MHRKVRITLASLVTSAAGLVLTTVPAHAAYPKVEICNDGASQTGFRVERWKGDSPGWYLGPGQCEGRFANTADYPIVDLRYPTSWTVSGGKCWSTQPWSVPGSNPKYTYRTWKPNKTCFIPPAV